MPAWRNLSLLCYLAGGRKSEPASSRGFRKATNRRWLIVWEQAFDDRRLVCGLSTAVVHWMGRPSARVQDFYAVSVQTRLCARNAVTGLIPAEVAFACTQVPVVVHAHHQALRVGPDLAYGTDFSLCCRQQERSL